MSSRTRSARFEPTIVARHLLLVAGLTLGALAGGCYRPGGAFMSYTGGAQTYYSTETMPKTVRLRDLRTSDVVFEMDIPPGKQLSLDFVTGDGDDPVQSPDLMRYEVFDMGTLTGKLTNAMSVPAASSRIIEVVLRDGVEYITAAPDRTLRTDELIDRPSWWTPEGGKLPEHDTGLSIYDD